MIVDDLQGEVTRGARAVIACPEFRVKGAAAQDPDARLEEARGLALAIGIEVVDAFIIPIREARAATLFGEGQIANIDIACNQNEAELVIIDGALSAIQQRNLEDKLKRKVIDRTGLILEIFGERAATAEGRLQVELAHLDYQAGRLVRSWTHLERQRGGFGFLGGPGETQIEADRRLIRDRMAKLRKELEQVRRTRGLHRERRGRAPWPIIALVGYTNAGKSTLFNRLTGADVMAENLLFATLDPTMRAVRLPGIDKAILSDTVGFISDLPTQLVAAFRATLEDAIEADVLLHVRDVAHEDTTAQAADVQAILRDLGIDPDDGQRVVEVWNKSDLLAPEERERQLGLAGLKPEVSRPVLVSALTGDGIGRLTDAIESRIARSRPIYRLALPPGDGQSLAWLHANGEILERRDAEDGTLDLTVRLPPEREGAFGARFPEAQREIQAG